MIERAKYVIVRYEPMGGIIMPLALPDALEHVAAKAVGVPVSAGFFSVDACGLFRVWGESRGLGLASRPQDAEILRVWFRPRIATALPGVERGAPFDETLTRCPVKHERVMESRAVEWTARGTSGAWSFLFRLFSQGKP